MLRLVLCGSLLLTLTACGGSSDDEGDSLTMNDAQGQPTQFSTSAGRFDSLQLVPAPTGASSAFSYPNGFFGLQIGGLVPGQGVTLTIRLAPGSAVPNALVKCNNNNVCTPHPATINGTVITLQLKDGGAGDTDGTQNGTIVDPLAPAVNTSGAGGTGGSGGSGGTGGTGGTAGSGGSGGSVGTGGSGGSAGSGGTGGSDGPIPELCDPSPLDAGCLSDIPTLGPVIQGLVDSLNDLLGGSGAAPQGAWLKGDLHVHDDHSSDGSLPRQTIGQGAPGNNPVSSQIFWAELVGLDFLPLNDHRTFNQHYDPQWQSSRLLLITGEEANSRPHATVFGAVDMINQAENPGGTPEFRKLQQSIWDAHLQGAAWTTAHPDDGEVNNDGTPNSFAFATGPNLVEIWNRGTLNGPKIAYCENRWNAGYRFGVAGASDNHFVELWPVAGPGEPTTHVFAATHNTPALLNALRAGRTAINLHAATSFATLEADFQGDGVYEAIAGDELLVAPGSTGRLRVTVTNGLGTQVHVYRMPGTSAGPFKTFQPMLPTQSFEFEVTADRAQDWYRVELRGPGDPDGLDYNAFLDGNITAALDPDVSNQLRALTSPVFISTGALATPDSPDLPADAGTSDNAALLFGESRDSAFAGFADVAESDGVVHAVAEVRGRDDLRVIYRQRRSNGTLAGPLDLALGSTLSRFPRIAASGGHVWVVWQDGRAGEVPHNTQIYLRHSADGGNTWEGEQQVSVSSARAEHPVIALLAPELPVVAWQDNGGGAFDVLARVIGRDTVAVNLSAAGKVTSAGVPFDSRSASYPASVSPSVAVRSDGLIAVAWQDNRNDVDPGWTGHATPNPQDEEGTETDDWEIFVATRQPLSAQWSAFENASQAPTLADRHPVLSFDAAGVLHAAWDSKIMAPAGPRLAIHVSHRTGSTWQAPTVVDAAPQFHAQRPVFGRNGNAPSLLWMDGRADDWRWRVRRANLDTQTGAWIPAGFVTGPGNNAWPAYSNGWLAFTSDRNAWREQRKPQQVFLRALDAPQVATVPSGDVAPITGGADSSFDLCLPVLGAPCLSQLPVLGPMLLGVLEPLLGGESGGAPDPIQLAAPILVPLAEGCHDNGGPAALCALLDRFNPARGPSRFVDPRIGSYPPGFTNPGPVLPFGMVALGPDTEGPLNYGGYSVQNSLITGFSHIHMSAGVFKGGQLPVMPFTGELVPPEPGLLDPGSNGYPGTVPPYASPFERASEVAEAGYYSTLLTRYGVLAELTATERVGLHRYTFHNPALPPRLLLDVSRMSSGYHAGEVTLQADGTLTGKVRNHEAGGFDIFFAARANASFTANTFAGNALAVGQAVAGNNVGVVLNFAAGQGPVLFKLALSYTDEQGALSNLEGELSGWDFDATRTAARGKWNDALSRIEVTGGTEAERISFYSALYRVHHFPNLHSDVDGRYRGPDNNIHADTRPHYSQFSSWDSYRGQNQLQAEIFPDIYTDMVRSLLAFHQQAGHLPRWQQGPKDASHMSGDPIMPFIGEAWCRGQLDADLRAQLWPALQALTTTAQRTELATRGYLAVPPPGNLVEEIEGGPGRAGTTLEYGIADLALALMAQDQAPTQAAAIAARALSYRNLLDPETKWIRPRHDDGSWLTPFAPELGYGFQEGTSWQYSWLVMQDLAGLIERMGGDAVVDQRLDLFFNFPASQAPLAWPTLQNQITAFGVAYYGNQYAPGNEHDLQAPYLYNYSGAPWKTQAVARAAASIYTPTATGLPGNDDLGALSGWLVWTMAGLYPMNPGTPLYVVGSPHFEKVTLKRPGGDLVIEAPGASAVNRFVTGAAINGQALNQSWLILPRAATAVRLDTSAAPDMNWGAATTARPPSLSTHSLTDFGCLVQ